MEASFSPRAFFTLLEAAEEALAVFSVQTLVDTSVLKVLPVHGVVQRDDGVWRSHIQDRVVLGRRRGRRKGRHTQKQDGKHIIFVRDRLVVSQGWIFVGFLSS